MTLYLKVQLSKGPPLPSLSHSPTDTKNHNTRYCLFVAFIVLFVSFFFFFASNCLLLSYSLRCHYRKTNILILVFRWLVYIENGPSLHVGGQWVLNYKYFILFLVRYLYSCHMFCKIFKLFILYHVFFVTLTLILLWLCGFHLNYNENEGSGTEIFFSWYSFTHFLRRLLSLYHYYCIL